MKIPIICHGCGVTGSVERVTAALQCGCGSNDLDIWDGQKVAASPGTGWNEPRPNVLEGWNEYEGPEVGPNPNGVDNGDHVTPDSYKRGNPGYIPAGGYEQNQWPSDVGQAPEVETYDERKKAPAGSAHWGSRTPLHITLPDGTKWEGVGSVVQAGRRSSDPLGSAEQYVSDAYKDPSEPGYRPPSLPSNHPSAHALPINAACPSCGLGKTTIEQGGNWNCKNCGPLANIDKNPEIDPYNPGENFRPMNNRQKAASVRKSSQLIKMVALIKKTNSGLSTDEALTLSRKALLKVGNN
jgi:rubredoxin